MTVPERGAVLLIAIAIVALATGCVSVEVGKDTPLQSQFRIADKNAVQSPVARSNGRGLVVLAQPSPSVDDSYSLAFSRQPNERAAYQFATWSDRPSSRLAQLLVDRLSARHTFASVALAGRGVAGDLQLNLDVNDFYHDASASPGSAHVEVVAELIDRGTRKLVARQSFGATEKVDRANAAGAAAALSSASTRVLDELVSWIEAKAAPSTLATTH